MYILLGSGNRDAYVLATTTGAATMPGNMATGSASAKKDA